MNKYDEVMTENLTKRFVDHRNVGLASETVTKVPLHHAESGCDVRPFVVVLHKLVLPELKVVVHLGPRSAAASAGTRFSAMNGTAPALVIAWAFLREP